MAPAGKVCQSCLNKINLNSIISSFLYCKVDALIRNASNCEAANIQTWLSNPNRNPLPSLSAIAYPRVQLEVVSIFLIFLRADAPSPINVAPLTASSILPFLTRYASVQEKTNFPLVISTCPPPKPTA